MHELIATKSLSYGGKRLEQGDDFKAKPRDARVLVAIGKAKHAPVEAAPLAPPAPAPAPVEPHAPAPAPQASEPAPAVTKPKGAAARREAKAQA